MIFSEVEIIDGECYVKMEMLENEIAKNKRQEQALNEIKEYCKKITDYTTIKIPSGIKVGLEIRKIIDKVGDNE